MPVTFRRSGWFALFACAGGLALAATRATAPQIVIIGDSTVCTYDSASTWPREGWGMELGAFFRKGSVAVLDLATSGRSCKSYIDEGRWTTALGKLGTGDFLMIQFGHNDMKSEDATRYADTAAYRGYLAKFIKEARAKGAHPILVTPMHRNAWTGGRTRDDGLADYAAAMIRTGKATGAPVVDLHALSKLYMDSVGQGYATWFHFLNLASGEYPAYSTGNSDNTHFQNMGALTNARLVARSIAASSRDSVLGLLSTRLAALHVLTVRSSLPGSDTITRSTLVPEGARVTVKIRPAAGKTFQNWLKDGSVKSTSKRIDFTQDAADHDFVAVYSGVAIPTGVEPVEPATRLRIRQERGRVVVDGLEVDACRAQLRDVGGRLVAEFGGSVVEGSFAIQLPLRFHGAGVLEVGDREGRLLGWAMLAAH